LRGGATGVDFLEEEQDMKLADGQGEKREGDGE
jgi:hypothetical protein